MADHADTAAELQELANQAALERHREQQTNDGEGSSTWCEECDEVIPHGRRLAVPGVKLCIQCASDLECQLKRQGVI